MNKTVPPVVSYVRALFRNGLESYNRETKQVENIGGAQLYQLSAWKGNRSPIHFNNQVFGNVLKELGATLYSLNKIRVDQDGNPVKVPGTQKNQRQYPGLLMYTQFGEDGQTARDFASRIIEACPELQGYVAPVVDLIEECPELNWLSTFQIQSNEMLGFMNPSKAIILAVPSGSVNSSQYWSYAKTNTTRQSLDQQHRVSSDGDVPFL